MARASKQTRKQIPSFRSEEDEARWYEAHRNDLHEYLDMDDAEVVEAQPAIDRGGMTQGITVRLPRRVLSGLRRVAEQQEVSYQILIRRWLTERLAQENATVNASRSSEPRSRVA